MNKNTIPARKDVPASDKWNLSSIFKSDDEWEAALKELPSLTKKVLEYKGKLGQSAETFLDALKALEAADIKMETVYHYASLNHEADEDDSAATERYGRATMAYTDYSTEISFFDPELQAIDEKLLRE